MQKTRVAIVLILSIISLCLFNYQVFSQGNIHLGPLKIHPSFKEQIEVDDNIYQVSGKGGGEEKQSDLINMYTPGLKLLLPLRGIYQLNDESGVSLDWKSDFKNYKDHPDQNQQNHYFTAEGQFKLPRGLDILLYDNYEDTWGSAGSETDQLHPRTTNTGKIAVSLPDYFRRFDIDLTYTNYDQEYDESALVRANRNEHRFTIKVPYKLTPKITVFPEYTHGITNIDRTDIADPLSNSYFNDILIGAEWQLTGKSKGIMKLGYRSRVYNDSKVSDVSTFISSIGARVSLSSRTNLDIDFARSQEESEFTTGSNAYAKNSGDLRISRIIRKKLTATLSGNYTKSVFYDSPRKDNLYKLGCSVKYDFNKWSFLTCDYGYSDKHSNDDTQSDRVNKASIGIGVAF